MTGYDEAYFKLSLHVSRHNCGYLAEKNPHLTIETELKQPGVMTWGALSSEGVIGPVFFECTVTADNYLEMLRDVVVRQLRTKKQTLTKCTSSKMEHLHVMR